MSSHEHQSLGWHPGGMVESAVLKCVGCCPLARGECDTWCPGVIPSTRGQPWLRMLITFTRKVGEFTPLAPVLLQELHRFGVAAGNTPSNKDCWNGGSLDKRSMVQSEVLSSLKLAIFEKNHSLNLKSIEYQTFFKAKFCALWGQHFKKL